MISTIGVGVLINHLALTSRGTGNLRTSRLQHATAIVSNSR